MDNAVTVNADQRLFVIQKDQGSMSALGFDQCFAAATQLAQALGRPDLAPNAGQIGTIEQYGQYRDLLQILVASKADIGTWFSPGTPEEVKEVLETMHRTETRVILHLGDPKTGHAWSDQPESGTIGRSMGPLKSPLLIKTSRSLGGEAILTNCIVRIQDAKTKRDFYLHPKYRPAAITTAPGM